MTEKRLSVRLAVVDGNRVEEAFKRVADRGEEAMRRIQRASTPASKGLQALDAAASDVRGSLEGMGSRLGPLGAALTRLGPAGIAAGAALGGITLGLRSSVMAAEEAAGTYRRLEAVLGATGYASGLTAKQISDFAQGIEESTLASSEAVMGAAGILATFRSISGDTFTRTLTLAQDMAAVFGQDLKASAIQLGKALEEPVEGISALRRVGVSFSQSQRDLIRTLVETGQTAAAQKVILDALEQQVGGAGTAEATGVTGAANRLSDAWGDLLKAIGRTPVVAKTTESALGGIGKALRGAVNLIEGDDNTPAEQRLLEQARALEGQRAAERERRAEVLAGQRKGIEDMLAKTMDSPAERVAQINKELETTRQRLNALRWDDGSNTADVDAAINQAEELARRRIDAVEKPLREARERELEQNRKVIDDLANRMLAQADKRQGFINQALARLSDGATEDQRREVARLSAQMYDQQQALEAANKAQEARNRLLEEGKRVTESHFTAVQAYEAGIAKLDQLLAEGAINATTHALAVQQAEERKLKASKDWRDGALRALKDYVDAATDAARNAEQVMTSVLKGSEDAFVRWATTGKFQARDLFNTVAEEALRAAYRMAVVRPLSGIFESAIGGFFGGSAATATPAATAHTGGVIGTDALQIKSVDPALFANAPRFHGGGVVGNEVPIIAQRGEVVFTPGQMAALGGAMNNRPHVNVAVNIENHAAKTEVRTETTRDSNGNMSLNVIIDEVESRLARNVGRGEGLAPTLERRYGLNPAAGSYR